MPTADSISTAFGLHVEYVDERGQLLHTQRLTLADFHHAIRHTSFSAFRSGLMKEYQPLGGHARIEPLFPNLNSPSPRARGFSVNLLLDEGRAHVCEFGISYFGSAANRLRAQLLRNQAMASEQQLYYRLNAFLDDQELVQPSNKLAISLEPARHNVSTAVGSRRDFAPAEAWDERSDSDLPVLFEAAVLEESVAEARSVPDREIAGFLLGQLFRDENSKEVFVAVTGLASASGTTEASGTSVTFTPASFALARDILKLRATGEKVVGWYHSHPFKLCAECPLPTPPECIAKVLFYSQDDIHLMETTFEHPFMVGLLVAVEPRIGEAVGHLPVRLYGWRAGEIRERGFDVVHTAGT
jgi:proteasome lid subunit RPN8/RPN11